MDDRDPQNADLGRWEELNEPIDVDIDEDDYVNQSDKNLISKLEKRRLRSKYHRSPMKK